MQVLHSFEVSFMFRAENYFVILNVYGKLVYNIPFLLIVWLLFQNYSFIINVSFDNPPFI